MSDLRCTLVTDGSSDRVLLPLIDWLLKQHHGVFQPVVWADLRQLPHPPNTLAGKLVRSVELYPCSILFVHRDAENEAPENRKSEIMNALEVAVAQTNPFPPIVCVIPVRMQEAWFLFDEAAIRRASGNPNGRAALSLPALPTVEAMPNPKAKLHDLLKTASSRRGRDLARFNPAKAVYQVANLIEDFTPLRNLPAFVQFERDLLDSIERHFRPPT